MRTLVILLAAALCSCASPKKVPLAPAPDVVAVKMPVEKAKTYAVKASGSVATAAASVSRTRSIVEAIKTEIPELAQIKLELATTQEALSLASAELEAVRLALDAATTKADELQSTVAAKAEELRIETLRANDAEKAVATKDAAIWDRNKKILWLSLIVGALILWILKGPLIRIARGFVLPLVAVGIAGFIFRAFALLSLGTLALAFLTGCQVNLGPQRDFRSPNPDLAPGF